MSTTSDYFDCYAETTSPLSPHPNIAISATSDYFDCYAETTSPLSPHPNIAVSTTSESVSDYTESDTETTSSLPRRPPRRFDYLGSGAATTSPLCTPFEHAITHVFFPLKLPEKNDCTLENDLSLASTVCAAAHAYTQHVHRTSEEDRWSRITKMLDNLQTSLQSECLDKDLVIPQLRAMELGDILTFFVRPQNAAIVLTKREVVMLFESFEVAPRKDAVEKTPGSLICSYPWTAVEVPNEVFDREEFQIEFANFLSLPSAVNSYVPHPPHADPEYVTALLPGILRGIGCPADVASITKHVRDGVGSWPLGFEQFKPRGDWRRSPVWLLIRIAIQKSVDHSPVGRASYKQFVLYFICTLARDEHNEDLSSDLLHLMSCKILRRLSKLGSFAPKRLSEMALETCARLRELLDTKWKGQSTRHSLFQNPSPEELVRDTKLSLPKSGEYIRKVLSTSDPVRSRTPFDPDHRRRGTLEDFLSSSGSFLDEAYDTDPDITMYDVEKSVELELDDWVAHVTNVDDDCARLEILMDRYIRESTRSRRHSFLTMFEFFVAIDKLAVREIPMLADYSPDIQIAWLERLWLCKATDLYRLSRVYQYLVARQSGARSGWLAPSDEFTEDTTQSSHRTGGNETIVNVGQQAEHEEVGLAEIRGECQGRPMRQRLPEGAASSRSPLPASLLRAKVIVFELQCPPCFRIWRSAIARIHRSIDDTNRDCVDEKECKLLVDVPELQPYFIKRQGPPLFNQIYPVYFSSDRSQSCDGPTLRYVIHDLREHRLHKWKSSKEVDFPLRHSPLQKYAISTSDTSNDILAKQANCPADLSLNEFITLGHLRSGLSLQWLNILRELHSRALNLRRGEVPVQLTNAICEVGPLDLNMGTWIWHEELQDTSFCSSLLDELDSAFMDGAGLVDAVFMRTISLLLTRILASSPSINISERAIAALRRVRKRTFGWVQDLSYDLKMAPTNGKRRESLCTMSAACRNTFDVDRGILTKLINSAEDVDALLFCFFLRAQNSTGDDDSRHLQLIFDSEEIMKDTILADPSDHGLDLAVARFFENYHPGAFRSEPLQHPNSRWLTCKANATGDQPSQMVHVNLVDGCLRVDGQPFGHLPKEIRRHDGFWRIFGHGDYFVVPSNLPGMDFMTLTMTSKYKVHFLLQGRNLVVRAQCNQTNQVLELIPSKILCKDLPPVLVDECIHWLNLATKVIEIRPLGQRWNESVENWRIECAPGSYHAYKGHESLVDTQSPTWAMLSRCFKCLGDKSIIVTTSASLADTHHSPPRRLSATLPCHALSFFVNDKEELESRDFRHMVYDEDQNIQTLFGLKNLLVLRPTMHISECLVPEALIARLVLSPDYCSVTKDAITHSSTPLSYHTFKVDPELGCLMGNGSPQSTQFLAGLHAKSSFHRPDPLTCKMGTQAALDLLQLAGCRSIMRLKVFHEVGFTTHPQLKTAHREIRDRRPTPRRGRYDNQLNFPAICAARRAAHLFPFDIAGSTTPEASNGMHYEIPKSNLELEDVASTVSSAIHRLSADMATIDAISAWVEIWKDKMCPGAASSESRNHPQTLAGPDFTQELVNRVCAILEEAEKSFRRFHLLFLLPTLAYCSPFHQTAFLSMLVAFAMQMESQAGNPPIHWHADHNILDGYSPTKQVIRDHIRASYINEWWDFDWEENSAVDAVVNHLLNCDRPSAIPPKVPLDSRDWNVEHLTTSLNPLFLSWTRNWSLKEQLSRILAVEPAPPTPACRVLPMQYASDQHIPLQYTLHQLLSNRSAPVLPLRGTFPRDDFPGIKTPEMSEDIPAMDQLFSSLQPHSLFHQQYIALLETSASVQKKVWTSCAVLAKDNIDTLQKHYMKCRASYIDALSRLKDSLGPVTSHEQALEQSSQWPPITADVLLRCLASTSPINLSEEWKKCLVLFAQLLLELQRARRLLRFALDGLEDEFWKEIENEQCDGWNSEKYPDWLLIQIQGDFLIRQVQAETAMELISPEPGGNTVMQVNMGEGKSSVIIPIVAAALADGKQLVRIIVPKALIAQMFDILVASLGGLANRPTYHLPFSREGYSDESDTDYRIEDLRRLMSQCTAERGVLLLQPEHVVSLKLMSVEKQIREGNVMTGPFPVHQKSLYGHVTTILSSRLFLEGSLVGRMFRWACQSANRATRESTHSRRCGDHCDSDDDIELADDTESAHDVLGDPSEWSSLQKWLHCNVRDILDESDEILHSRFQLIYTIGFEQHIDGYPSRWTTTQGVLRLAKEHLRTLSGTHPNAVKYERGPPGSFPRTYIVQDSDIGQRLVSMIAKDVMAGRLANFNFQRISNAALREAIHSFISDKGVLQVSDTAKRVEEYATRSNQSYLWNGLLLLRGLLSSDILLFALTERRWRVDYGLLQRESRSYDRPTRPPTLLAVPYRAKDVPAPNTQFGHPDLTIILTCLCYYYAGLTEEQLRASFEILLDLDDPSVEYNRWIEDCTSIPDSLRNLGEINPRSSEQWDKVTFPLFSRNQATVDFYLSRVVFPREAKEFPWKLSGSSWDLGEERKKLITGFSGTSDGRWLLPMSVIQHDLGHQRGTSASVLTWLLRQEQERDSEDYTVTHQNGEQQTTHELLKLIAIQQPEIRVFLDVGAQVLDLSNSQVAEAWLDIARDAVAAIYFDENDELTVLTRSGKPRPLSSSPLSQQLRRCVVYLDHPHTRGTDLKFPMGSRAAVTLGPKVSKDALMQGCMRMRKLGHGHTVMFLAPPGVDQSIRAVTRKQDPNAQVTITDVLSWAIHETWTEIQRRAPYWAQQGIDYQSRSDVLSRFCNDELSTAELSNVWLQPNCKSLSELYAPRVTEDVQCDLSVVPGMEQRCKDLGILSIPRRGLEEEQEREVHRERERERELELPPKAKPAEHFLHPDVEAFVKTGIIPPLYSSSAFLPIFTTLERSSATTRDADVWSSSILATADFSRTIKPESTKGTLDQYLRPVQWILSSKTDHHPVLVILSPFEADLLMPQIRVSKYVHLHLYAPRTAQRMKPSDDLCLYAIPPLPFDWTPPWELIDQLNVFSGQLYLRDYPSYLRLCRFLDVPADESPSSNEKVRRNLFNIPGSFEKMEILFADSPLPTVMALLAIRTRGRPFDHTHMGKILQGQILTEKEFGQPTSKPNKG